MLSKIWKGWLEISLLAVLVVVTAWLRFPSLGYSDYIGDEHKAFFQLEAGQTTWEFFMEQRKGPMQFLVSYVPYLFTHDFRNEFAERLPFTLFNFASVFVFYAFVRRLTENRWAALLAAFLFSTNGFIVGFSRIAQYQSLNLFFSSLALYLYTDFMKPTRKILRNTLIGTAAFSLSLLSHWDAIFILPIVGYFLAKFWSNKSLSKSEKVRVLTTNFALGCVLLLPFLIPYISYQFGYTANQQYFTRRVEIGNTDLSGYEFLIRLYNPFLVLEFLLAAVAVSLVLLKKTWPYLLWFVINFSVFAIFVKKADTHVYNFLIPAIVLGSVGIVLALEKLPWLWKYVWAVVISLFLVFFAHQSYVIFVDHKTEYPWRQEAFFGKDFLTTRKYTVYDSAPLFGFPHSRGWNEINDFVNAQNSSRGESFGYQTNEAKTISEWYMDVGNFGQGFYAVGIKWPVSFANDMKFTQFGRKEIVHEVVRDGQAVVRIYRVPPR